MAFKDTEQAPYSAPVNDGGAAFPNSVPHEFQYAHDGMTLRDYFAAKALAGHYADWGTHSMNEIATLSYTMADAMLAAREVRK